MNEMLSNGPQILQPSKYCCQIDLLYCNIALIALLCSYAIWFISQILLNLFNVVCHVKMSIFVHPELE